MQVLELKSQRGVWVLEGKCQEKVEEEEEEEEEVGALACGG